MNEIRALMRHMRKMIFLLAMWGNNKKRAFCKTGREPSLHP
jgi:hypothetical protein